MSSKPISGSDVDLVDWIARGMIAITAIVLVAVIAAGVFIGFQVNAPSVASPVPIPTSAAPVITGAFDLRALGLLIGAAIAIPVMASLSVLGITCMAMFKE